MVTPYMDSTVIRVLAIGASRATENNILRRNLLSGANTEKGMYHLHLLGISLCVLPTPLFRWNRRYAWEMMSASQKKGNKSYWRQSFSTTVDLRGQSLRTCEDSVVVLETGAAANMARFRRLGNRKFLLGEKGSSRISTYPARARYKIGDGRPGAVRSATGIALGNAARGGTPATFALEADIPALLREGALGALGGQSDSACDVSTFWGRVAEMPSKANQMWRKCHRCSRLW